MSSSSQLAAVKKNAPVREKYWEKKHSRAIEVPTASYECPVSVSLSPGRRWRPERARSSCQRCDKLAMEGKEGGR